MSLEIAQADVRAFMLAIDQRGPNIPFPENFIVPGGKLQSLYADLIREEHEEFDAAALDAMGSERIAGWLARNQPGPGTLLGMWAKLVGECE